MRLTYLRRMTVRHFKELLILATVCFGYYLVHFWWTTMSLKDALRWYCKLRPEEYRDPYINLHRYEYNLSPTVCSHQTFNIFIVVQSGLSNTKRRQVIRDSYGSVRRFHGMSLGLVFLLGSVDDSTLQGKITKEFEDHNDIVQGNVYDNYAFLNQKHIMAMDWFLKNCQSDFVAKLDDDTFLNPFRLVDYLSSLRKPLPNMMFCKVMKNEMPVREPTSKWHTPWYQYPFKRFPPFCLGFAYITTPKVWATLYEASKTYRQMDMDDVYVSAVLGASTDLYLKDIEDLMYDCLQHRSSVDVDSLRRSVLVLDRWNSCGDKPFKHWEGIKQ
ncbi:beta-1,3-galactosyltransferase 5-like [Haliotis rubra]|uniref:beta-1,3-galactosyltransferase 5-like n=1 Tax=Haliotis rubra TaxID=36100 RepID=UPI001EE56F70|nr:beta-1,3-galactosyltransferase 5-like [Haliotis rubra]